jgi:hypothetical protein
MYLLGLRPVRCLTCNKRFYARYSIDGDRLKVGPAHHDLKVESGHHSAGGESKRAA